jgi:hypothetical protein
MSVTDVENRDQNATSAALAHARREVEGLRAALETRHTIGLAQGILMARHTLTVAQAFDRLSHRSQSANIKLRDVAVGVVAELDAAHRAPVDGQHPGPQEPGDPPASGAQDRQRS